MHSRLRSACPSTRSAFLAGAVAAAGLAQPAAPAVAATKTVGPGKQPAVVLESPTSALVTYLRTDGTGVAVCRVRQDVPGCSAVADVTIPSTSGIRLLGHPSLVYGGSPFEDRGRWFLVVADHYANATWVAESTDAPALTFAPPIVARGEAFSALTQDVLSGAPTPNSLTLVSDQGLASDSIRVTRIRKGRDGWGGGTSRVAAFTPPKGVFPQVALTAVGNPTGSGSAGEIIERTILVSASRTSPTSLKQCLVEFDMDSESSAITADPNYGSQDPGRQELWKAVPGCIAKGRRPSFAPAAGAQVLSYIRESVFKGASVSFYRYTLAGGRESGPKGLNTDFSKGRFGVDSATFTRAADGKLTLLWFTGKGQRQTLGVAHSSGGRNASWTGKRKVGKSNFVGDTLSGATWADGSGAAVWQDNGNVKIATFPRL